MPSRIRRTDLSQRCSNEIRRRPAEEGLAARRARRVQHVVGPLDAASIRQLSPPKRHSHICGRQNKRWFQHTNDVLNRDQWFRHLDAAAVCQLFPPKGRSGISGGEWV